MDDVKAGTSSSWQQDCLPGTLLGIDGKSEGADASVREGGRR